VKTIIISVLLLAAALPASAGPRTYAEAANDLGWLSREAGAYRKNLKEGVQRQATNLAVRNQLEQAKAKVEEMIQRDNISKACKVVEYGFTAATLGSGAVAAAGANSLMTAAGMKEAGKYLGKGIAVEAAKDAAGTPGYSDAVKAGMFVFNKVDENEIKAQLGKGDIDLLLKAKALLEDESDGRTLKEKLPELRDLLNESETRIEQTGAGIKASAELIDKTLEKAGGLSSEASRLKAEEEKKEKEAYEAARLKKPEGLVNTQVPGSAEVAPPASDPKESEEEKRKKMQAAITAYIQKLSNKYWAEDKAGREALGKLKYAQIGSPGDAGQLQRGLQNYQDGLATNGSYSHFQEIEEGARFTAKALADYRAALEQRRTEVKTIAEAPLGRMADLAADWRAAIQLYRPAGYHVPDAPEVQTTQLWSAYADELNFIERYRAETEGLEGRFSSLASAAAGQKAAVYSAASDFAGAWAAQVQAYKAEAPAVQARLAAMAESLAKKLEAATGLPHEFAAEFSYGGKRDLANLEPKVAAARGAYTSALAVYKEAALLAASLSEKSDRLNAMADDPLVSEARNIAAMSHDAGHKAAMNALLKPLEGSYRQQAPQTGAPDFVMAGAAEAVFGGEAALRYLRAAEKRMLDAAASGTAALKAAYSGLDIARLKTASSEDYGKAFMKVGDLHTAAMDKIRAIQEEVTSTYFFDPVEELKPQKLNVKNTRYGPVVEGKQPLLFGPGFWPAPVNLKVQAMDKVNEDFWASPAGKELSEARRLKELEEAQNTRDPGLAVVRRMYEDFAKAYESRNAARVMSFISDSWSAGDGTAASDLDEQFRNIFRIYDEITVAITGLNIVNDGPGRYTASYDMDIRSRIYKKNIKREEKSSVYEHVAVEGGAARITKTESGGYWDIK
jgi:hypothetical protein